MADQKLNSLATKTNANAAAILVKDSATQNQGAEGWITKAQLNQIIRDEVKAQLSAITSGTPDVPVLDGSTMKYMTLANFTKVVGVQQVGSNTPSDVKDINPYGLEIRTYNTGTLPTSVPTASANMGGDIVLGNNGSPKLEFWVDRYRNLWARAGWYGAYGEWLSLNDSLTTITSGDLNDYKTVGAYAITSATYASAISNVPTEVGGRLEVKHFVTDTTILQIYYTYAQTPRVYLRRYNNSTWDSWQQLAVV